MTCREKLAIEHPEKIGKQFMGGCEKCPHDYGYMSRNDRFCKKYTDNGFSSYALCAACWGQELGGSKATKLIAEIKPQIDISALINNAMKDKDKTVQIIIMDGNMSIDVKPFTNTKPHWIYREGEGRYEFECSECGYHHEFESPFCPECGEKLSKSEV